MVINKVYYQDKFILQYQEELWDLYGSGKDHIREVLRGNNVGETWKILQFLKVDHPRYPYGAILRFGRIRPLLYTARYCFSE